MQSVQSRLQQFRKEIRRREVERNRARFRNECEFEFTTIPEVAQCMNSTQRDPSLEDLMEEMAPVLAKPPLSEALYDQRQEVVQAPLEAHTKCWKFYSEQLYLQDKLMTETIKEVLMAIVRQYNYQQIHECTSYQLQLLNTLQLTVKFLSRNDRDYIMDWIGGAESIRLVAAVAECEEFMDPVAYSTAYEVIELGLKSEIKAESEEAAQVISLMLRHADFDGTFKIYQQFHGLISNLCIKIERYCPNERTRSLNQALMHLLSGYDDMIVDYANSGAGYTASLLIMSEDEGNQTDGLNIMAMLASVDSSSMGDILVKNQDIIQTKVWTRLLGTNQFSRSYNLLIRRYYYSIFEGLFAHSTKKVIEMMCSKISGPHGDFYMWIGQSLESQEDSLVLISVLNTLSSLMYYQPTDAMQHLQKESIPQMVRMISEGDDQKVADMAKQMILGFKETAERFI